MLNQIYFANDTNWQSLIDAISNAGGGGSPILIDSTQWQDLLDEVEKGDTSNLSTILTTISGTLAQMKLALDAVVIDNTQWNALISSLSTIMASADVYQNPTQWANLVNAITNQQITLNFNDINTDVVRNMSKFNGQYLSTILNYIYDNFFTIDPNIIQWTVIDTFTQFDVYILKLGIIKLLWIDTAKNNIPSGWQTGGVGTLPVGFNSILSPTISENKALRNGANMTIGVNNNGVLNVNPTASIASGTQIRCLHIYI